MKQPMWPETGSRRSRGKDTVRKLVIFAAVVLASGWIGRGLDVLMGNEDPESLGMLVWIVLPIATALSLELLSREGWGDWGLTPRMKGNLAWYFVAVAVYPTVTLAIMLSGASLGSISFSNFSAGTLLSASALALAPGFIKNIFEEFAWRGYLTPKTQSLAIHSLWGHVIVGLIWGLWHLPYFLFFLPPSVIPTYTALSLGPFILMAIATMVSWSFVYCELRLLTGSVWPAVLMHMMEDAFVNELLLEGHVAIVPELDWLLSPGIGVLNMALFFTIGLVLYRLRRERVAGPR